MSIKKFFNYLIFGKISLGLKDHPIFEEKATDENSIRNHLTTKLKARDNDGSSEAMCQVGRDMAYMATMFPFSPPVENNNMPPAVEEISDCFGAQNDRLTQMGYMATMFPFSPPVENNNTPTAVEEISDLFRAQNNRLTQVKRKSDVMLSGDEPLFKKHKHFASVLTIDPTTELKISLAEPPTTNNRRPIGVVLRSAPVDIPKKRY